MTVPAAPGSGASLRANAEPPAWCKAASAVERFAIRSLRILGGIVLVGIAVWLFAISIEVLQEPFASLSPLALLGGIAAGLGGLVLLMAAFGVAFGEAGESRVATAWHQHYLTDPKRRRKLAGYDE